MLNQKLPAVWYGADYNPDQWPEEVWQEDVRLMKAAGVNIVTVPVFSWVKLQPDEDTYDFEWLDRVLDLLHANGVYTCLATSTAAQPAWMSAKYPDVLPVGEDGRKRKHGWRQNYCPNSPNFRRLSRLLAAKLAERYKGHPGLVIWHISNEYGPTCYCDTCEAAFRGWLREQYGTLDELNRRWYNAFWSHSYTAWEEIEPPTTSGERSSPGLLLDYRRFQSDSNLACYRNEYDAIKAVTPDVPITTNLMGTYQDLDYFDWAPHLDVVSYDSYPRPRDPAWMAAFRFDLTRGLKAGQPWMLMEQTPDKVNWQRVNQLKPPGKMRLQSLQAIAHGSDSVMYFQWRHGRGGYEKYHGAFVNHVRPDRVESTHTFVECRQLGDDLKRLTPVLGARVPARVALLFDWDNWWSAEFGQGPSEWLYCKHVEEWYATLHAMNVAVEIANPQQDLSRFDVVVAPGLYMLEPGTAEALKAVAERGGAVVADLFTGLVDESDLVWPDGYLGPLQELFGVWLEEFDGLFPDDVQTVRFPRADFSASVATARVHPETANVEAAFKEGWPALDPAVTRNAFGSGEAVYVATHLDDAGREYVLKSVLESRGIASPFAAPEGVEVLVRENANGRFTFVLNHNPSAVNVVVSAPATDLLTGGAVAGSTALPGYGALVLAT